jgi:hypothetical protein
LGSTKESRGSNNDDGQSWWTWKEKETGECEEGGVIK